MPQLDPLRIVANLTHELKTPLHAILSTASILDSEIDGKLSTEQKKQVGIVIRNGEHLLEMITSLLSYSSTVTASRELTISRISPGKVLQKVFQELHSLAASRGINFTFQNNSNLYQFYTDKELLLRIYSNILSNSIKFTKSGGTVDVLVIDYDQGIRIRIADSGVGMSPETKEQIFSAFFQADSSSTREFGGVGLGLSLVKVALDQIDAKIKVESELNQGSIFTIDVPNLKDKMKQYNIVIIGVEDVLKSSLKLSLEEEGYSLTFLENIDTAKNKFALKSNLFVIDDTVNLNVQEVIKEIRQLPEFQDTPILGLLSSKDSKARQKAIEAGFDDTLSKPFDFSDILTRIKVLLNKEYNADEKRAIAPDPFSR